MSFSSKSICYYVINYVVLRSKDNLYKEIVDFISPADELIIIAPYIKLKSLSNLINKTTTKEIC